MLSSITATSIIPILSGKDFSVFFRQLGNLQLLCTVAFLNIDFSENLQILTSISKLAYWGFIPNPFNWLFERDSVDPSTNPSKFDGCGFRTQFLDNLGQIIFIFIFFLIWEAMLAFLGKNSSQCVKYLRFVGTQFLGARNISRFIYHNPLLFTIPLLLSYLGPQFSSSTNSLSSVLSYLFGVLFVGSAIHLIRISRKKSSEFKKLITTQPVAFESFSKPQEPVISFHIFGFIRAIAVSLSVILLYEVPGV
jgi:hypothetical protein